MNNWKTTAAGVLAAVAMAWANYSGANTWQGYLSCLGPVVIGALAKDWNTHSTVAQTQTATAVAQADAINAANSVK